MRRLLTILTTVLLSAAFTSNVSDATTQNTWNELSLAQLEHRVTELDAELSNLAPISLRSGVGAVGYRSGPHKQPDHAEWVQIDFGAEFPIDQVVIVPTIGRDSKAGLQADGFPLEFRIIVGTTDTSTVVASFTAEDRLLPRIAPLVVSFDQLTASWVRLECTLLSPRRYDHLYLLQLSEMMVFSGRMNVALRKPVTASSSYRGDPARHERFLVDGYVPFLMDSAHGDRSTSRAFRIPQNGNTPTLTIDLGASYPINQVNLHAIDLSHSIPEAVVDGYGVPKRLQVMGANRPDFSDQQLLYIYNRKSIYDAGPIIMHQFSETHCRYVRIAAVEFDPKNLLWGNIPRIGFAEIEILSDGQNIVPPNSAILNEGNPIQHMTDRHNFYGEILPTREWMNQLARRHDLESERPSVMAELSHRYTEQKAKLTLAAWLIGILLIGSVVLVLVGQNLRQRAVFRTRERIAANLHDELGANLHAIGLLGDTAKKVVDQRNASAEWSDLVEIVDDVRELTEETGSTARLFSSMLESDGIYQNLVDNMKRMSDRLLADLDHDFSVVHEDRLPSFQAGRRIDLILFYKECLTNIIRHSGATIVSTKLIAEKKEVCLIVSDNGRGTQGKVPASLKRRAHLLGGHVSAEGNAEGIATVITLRFRPRRRWLPSRLSKLNCGKPHDLN